MTDVATMPTIIRRLPFVEKDRELSFAGLSCVVRHNQIVVWLSVLQTGLSFDTSSPPPLFPAILDTGHNHNFIIQDVQLASWANYSKELLPYAGTVYVNREPVELYDANLWLYPNIPGQIEPNGGAVPVRLPINGGIAISTQKPRVPLLGIRAMRSAMLHLSIHSAEGLVSIRAPADRSRTA
jgi:hypothetical protein